uniref:Uncharacterized protein n=1 Tax=Anguilla anguilla TaxID=7936 RepID=A0A0E9RW01_ANGAN
MLLGPKTKTEYTVADYLTIVKETKQGEHRQIGH